jgi:hypothetical protein
MNARPFKSDRHQALDTLYPPEAPDVRLSHSALMRAHAPARPPALSPLQRLARGVAAVFNRNS